jgi:hypothetical protein
VHDPFRAAFATYITTKRTPAGRIMRHAGVLFALLHQIREFLEIKAEFSAAL